MLFYGNLPSYENAWYIEFLQGVTFAIPYATITVFVGKVADNERTKSTLQTLVCTIFVGIGFGSGAIMGALLNDTILPKYIPEWRKDDPTFYDGKRGELQCMFRFIGYFFLICSVVFMVWDLIAVKVFGLGEFVKNGGDLDAIAEGDEGKEGDDELKLESSQGLTNQAP